MGELGTLYELPILPLGDRVETILFKATRATAATTKPRKYSGERLMDESTDVMVNEGVQR